MSRRVVFRPEAHSDIVTARDWYDDQSPGLGADFIGEVEATLALILGNPLQYQRIRGGVRRAVLHRFPYGLIYAPSDVEVLILACVHGRQSPKVWQERMG